jgi:hypothetical protein
MKASIEIDARLDAIRERREEMCLDDRPEDGTEREAPTPPADRAAREFWEREFERRDALSVARVCVGTPDADRELASEMAGHGRRADAALAEWRKRWGGAK